MSGGGGPEGRHRVVVDVGGLRGLGVAPGGMRRDTGGSQGGDVVEVPPPQCWGQPEVLVPQEAGGWHSPDLSPCDAGVFPILKGLR